MWAGKPWACARAVVCLVQAAGWPTHLHCRAPAIGLSYTEPSRPFPTDMAAATHPTLAWSSANPTPSTPPSASTRLHTGQALNLAKLRKALGLSGAGPEAGGVSIGVSGVGVPASVALPYGSFERCLREEPRNAAAAAEVARLTAAAAAAAAGGGLPKAELEDLRRLVSEGEGGAGGGGL